MNLYSKEYNWNINQLIRSSKKLNLINYHDLIIIIISNRNIID